MLWWIKWRCTAGCKKVGNVPHFLKPNTPCTDSQCAGEGRVGLNPIFVLSFRIYCGGSGWEQPAGLRVRDLRRGRELRALQCCALSCRVQRDHGQQRLQLRISCGMPFGLVGAGLGDAHKTLYPSCPSLLGHIIWPFMQREAPTDSRLFSFSWCFPGSMCLWFFIFLCGIFSLGVF